MLKNRDIIRESFCENGSLLFMEVQPLNKKVSLGICIALIVIAVAATFSATMVFSKGIYNKLIGNISQRSQMYSSIDEINQIVSNYFYGSTQNTGKMNASLSDGYIKGLGDSASRYMTSEEHNAYTSRLEGGVTSIGVETAYDYQNDRFVITHVYAESPAETAGLLKGDVITAIGHHDEKTAAPVTPLAAALILADKSDVRTSRVRSKETVYIDIHDRVNYAVFSSKIDVDREKRMIILTLKIDTLVCPVMEYFEIFLERMVLCKKSAAFLKCDFELIINDTRLL